jgi:hypothetical protein
MVSTPQSCRVRSGPAVRTSHAGTICWIASYPKSGNTWLRMVLANYCRAREELVGINSIGGAIAASREMFEEFVGIDSSELTPMEIELCRPDLYRGVSSRARGTTFLKVHDAYARNAAGHPLFPPEATRCVIYLIRNPLDVAVSYAHHLGVGMEAVVARMNDEEAVISTRSKGLSRQLMQRLGSWSGHARSWMDDSRLPLVVARYEDMRENPFDAFSRIIGFCGIPLVTERLEQCLQVCSFQKLREQEAKEGFVERPACSTAPFFRRGRTGAWREELSPRLAQRLIKRHSVMMRRFGYLDENNEPTF